VPWWARIHLLLFVFGVGLAMIQERFGRVVDRFGLGLWAALALIVATPVAALTLHVALSPQTEALIAVVSVALGAMSVGHAWERVTPLVRLGDASYVLYLGHSAVLGGLSMVWLALFGPRLPVAFGLLAVAASCAIAWPLHRWIEKPITRRLRLLLEPKPHAVMVLSRSAKIPAA
jgi:peptidoglycan/LPS O-acetylase OafA/YrhL